MMSIVLLLLLFSTVLHEKAFGIPTQAFPVVPQLELGDVMIAPMERKLAEALQLVRTNRLNEAIPMLRTLLKEVPGSAPGHELLGATLVLKGQIEEGMRELQEAVKIDPKQSSAYTKIGDVYLMKGKKSEAMAAFRMAIDITPQDRRAHQRIGLLFDQAHKAKEAIEHYELGLEGTPPEYVGIKVDLARLYVQMGQGEKAITLIKNLVPDSFPNGVAHLTLGHAYLQQQLLDEAMHQYELAAKCDPKINDALLALGGIYREKRRHSDSVEILNRFIVAQPNQSAGYYQLGETYIAMKEYDKSLVQFQKAKSRSKNPSLIVQRIADVYLQQNQASKAISIYKSIIGSKGATVRHYDLLGTAYQQDMQLKEAEQTFKQMVKLFKQDAFAHYRFGLFYGYVGKLDESISELEKAQSLKPDEPATLKALSNAYYKKGLARKAVETAGRMVTLLPDDLDQKAHLAMMYEADNRAEEAEELYRVVLAKDPKHLVALNNLAALMTEAGDLNQAVLLGKQAIAIAKNEPHILDTFAWARHKQGQHADALKLLEHARTLSLTDPTILYHLGSVHAAMEHRDEARRFIKQALSLSTSFPGVDDAKTLEKSLRDVSLTH